MAEVLQGFHRKIHHTRYAKKALNKGDYLNKGQEVVVLTKDGKYPIRELGKIDKVEVNDNETIEVHVKLDSGDYNNTYPGDIFVQDIHNVDILLETEWEETADRAAKAISEVEKLPLRGEVYQQFKHEVENFNLVPAGRILTGAGDDSNVTLFNCYVIDVEKPPHAEYAGADSRQAIFHHMGRISEIMARGGGVGTCLSVFRPRYSGLNQTKGKATGSIYIGNMFSQLTDFVEQANRRGAQMLTQFDWHPDVFYTNDKDDPDYKTDFIGAKQNPGYMEGNNSSVLVSDLFMNAVENDEMWDLKFPDTSHPAYNEEWDGNIYKWESKGYPVVVHRTVRAAEMYDKMMESNHSSAEPGILYIDRINYMHNGHYLGTVKATNPCGEQPILGNSTCNLSAVNMGRMLKPVGEDEEGIIYEIDWAKMEETIETGVRFLDNVIDSTFYFDEDMKYQQLGERRLGLGVLGVHDQLIGLRKTYGDDDGNETLDKVFKFLRDTAYRASIKLAKEKGSFPFFDAEKFLESGFVKNLPQDIQDDIRIHGIRNLTLLTIAPTGTTGSMTPSWLDPNGSVSTGIEPHFAMKYNRMSRIGNTVQYAGVAKVYMDAHPESEKLPDYYVGSMDLLPEQHVKVQAVAQKYVCSSISKTVNAPKNYTVEQVKRAYMLGYKLGLKGMTIYRDGSRYEQILSTDDEEEDIEDITEEVVEVPDKYKDWTCQACGHDEFNMIEGCPQCKECGSQSCSI